VLPVAGAVARVSRDRCAEQRGGGGEQQEGPVVAGQYSSLYFVCLASSSSSFATAADGISLCWASEAWGLLVYLRVGGDSG